MTPPNKSLGARAMQALSRVTSLGLIFYILLPIICLLKGSMFDVVNCVTSSFHNAGQLNDIEYGLQVTKDCWTFGMHTDDYLEYPTNSGPLYLRKYLGNNTGTIEFYEREGDERRFLNNQMSECFLICLFQVLLALISMALAEGKLLICNKIVGILNFCVSFYFFCKVKLIANGEYSSATGLRYADLLTVPRWSFKVDQVPSNFVKSSTFRRDDLRLFGSLLSPSILYYLTTIMCWSYFLVFVTGALVHPIQLISMIFAKKTSVKISKKSAAKPSASIAKEPKKPASNSQTKNEPEEVVVG